MADLTDLQAAGSTKIVGSDSTGIETNAVGADSNQNLQTIDYATKATGGSVPTAASFIGAKNPSNNLVGLLTNSDSSLNITAPDITSSSSISSAGQASSFICNSLNTVIINIGGAWSGGTLVFEFSQDGTQFWTVNTYEIASTFVTAPSVSAITSTNHSGVYLIPCSSFNQVRVRATALSSGTVTIAFIGSVGSQYLPIINTTASNLNAQVVGNIASSTTDSGNPVKISGVYNSTQPTVTNGQRVDTQSTSRGATIVATGSDNFNINNVSGTISLPTGAATSANQTTIITALQIIDDIPHANNDAFVKGVPMMGQLDDTSTVVATENNVSVARITAQRAVHVNIRNNSGTEIATSSNPLRIDPTGTTTQPVSQSTASNLNAQVVGNIASASSDSGNPVKIGSIYNSTNPTFTNGQRADVQSNQFGHIAITYRQTYSRTSGNATTTAKSGSGTLHGIIIGANWTGGTGTIYDNTAGSGTIIMQLDFGTPSGGLLSTSGQPGPVYIGPLGIEFATGLTIVTSGSGSNDVTLVFK